MVTEQHWVRCSEERVSVRERERKKERERESMLKPSLIAADSMHRKGN